MNLRPKNRYQHHYQHSLAKAMTLVEVTIILSVLLGLVALSFFGATRYQAATKRASCLMSQDILRKSIMANANLSKTPLEQGVDYYIEPSTRAIFELMPTCPVSEGHFSCILNDRGDIVIRCLDHEEEHRQVDNGLRE